MKRLLLLAALSPLAAGSAQAQQGARPDGPVISVGGQDYYSWQDYLNSNAFRAMSLRCGLPPVDPTLGNKLPPSDCSAFSTTISPQYNASNGTFQIPVVVHIIMNTAGQGAISDAKVQSQIDILNEDFQAIVGTNGAPGNNAAIQFALATVDPNGNPTTGITRSTNNTWFNDSGQYYNTLAWDTNRYLNIYTNQAGGALGYVPAFPQNGIVGSKSDRVVILWSAFGRNAPIGPPYNQGRTTTHEVGHYFGLYHTFQGGCQAVSNCYNNGDRICDTNPEGQAHFGCPNSTSCSSPDPVTNYMDYTDDLCMNMFTLEQVNRMRCTITHYRPDLPTGPTSCAAASVGHRIAGNNLDVYTATAPVIGQPVTFTVDTQGFQFATIFGVTQSLSRPLDSGDWVLINVDSPLSLMLGPLPGPIAQTTQVVANDPSMCGLTIYTQAKLHNVAKRPFRLTNSQDLVVGN